MKSYGQIIQSDAAMILRASQNQVMITCNFLAADNYRDSPDAPKQPGCAQGWLRQIQLLACPVKHSSKVIVSLWAGPIHAAPGSHVVISAERGGKLPGMTKIAEEVMDSNDRESVCSILSGWASAAWDMAEKKDHPV